MGIYLLVIEVLLSLWDPTMVSRGSRPAQRDPSSLSRVAGPGRSEALINKQMRGFLKGKKWNETILKFVKSDVDQSASHFRMTVDSRLIDKFHLMSVHAWSDLDLIVENNGFNHAYQYYGWLFIFEHMNKI
jgi:hypothetical protein